MKSAHLITIVTWLGLCAAVFCAPQTDEEVQKLLDGLKWREGSISLEKGIATINLRDGYRYLNEEDASKVLNQVWGNPPEKNMGMIFPAGTGPLDAGWAVIVEGFEEEGYVKDEDAGKLDADKLLKQLQEGQRAGNVERKKQGYPELELVGWAVPPRYDKDTKKLYWALDIKRVGSATHSVNYYLRILGRRGYFVLNALGSMERIQEIEKATPQFLSMVDFNEGHRYADFNPKTDKTAAYGIAALVAGGIAAKAGLFKGLWIALLAAKKFVIAGLVVVAGLFKKLWSKISGRKDQEPQA